MMGEREKRLCKGLIDFGSARNGTEMVVAVGEVVAASGVCLPACVPPAAVHAGRAVLAGVAQYVTDAYARDSGASLDASLADEDDGEEWDHVDGE